jgi:hypothetical protein
MFYKYSINKAFVYITDLTAPLTDDDINLEYFKMWWKSAENLRNYNYFQIIELIIFEMVVLYRVYTKE